MTIEKAWNILNALERAKYVYFGQEADYNKTPWTIVQLDGWYTPKELSLIIKAMDAARRAEKDKP